MLLRVAIGRFNNDDISRDYLSFVLKSFVEIIIVKHSLSVSDRTVAQNYWGHQLRCRRFSFLFNLNNKLSSLTIRVRVQHSATKERATRNTCFNDRIGSGMCKFSLRIALWLEL